MFTVKDPNKENRWNRFQVWFSGSVQWNQLPIMETKAVLHTKKKDYGHTLMSRTDLSNGSFHQSSYLFTCTNMTTFSMNMIMITICCIAIYWW